MTVACTVVPNRAVVLTLACRSIAQHNCHFSPCNLQLRLADDLHPSRAAAQPLSAHSFLVAVDTGDAKDALVLSTKYVLLLT